MIEPDKCRTCPLQSALIELSIVPFGREITFFTFETDFDFLPLISVSRTFDAFIDSEPFAKFKLKKRELDLEPFLNFEIYGRFEMLDDFNITRVSK